MVVSVQLRQWHVLFSPCGPLETVQSFSSAPGGAHQVRDGQQCEGKTKPPGPSNSFGSVGGRLRLHSWVPAVTIPTLQSLALRQRTAWGSNASAPLSGAFLFLSALS